MYIRCNKTDMLFASRFYTQAKVENTTTHDQAPQSNLETKRKNRTVTYFFEFLKMTIFSGSRPVSQSTFEFLVAIHSHTFPHLRASLIPHCSPPRRAP